MTDGSARAPQDADRWRSSKPVVVYPSGTLPRPDTGLIATLRRTLEKKDEIIVPAREARTFRAARGQFFRIVSIEGPHGRSGRALLQREDTRAARDACEHGRSALEHLAVLAAIGNHHPRYARLVRLG
jgi:uncharacterized protein YcgI (DUF1989 family)